MPTKVISYACLFVCLVAKEVHIEICSELSLEALLATFKRFCARRGYPTTVYSDNGRNFLGANRALKYMLTILLLQQVFVHILSILLQHRQLSGNSFLLAHHTWVDSGNQEFEP